MTTSDNAFVFPEYEDLPGPSGSRPRSVSPARSAAARSASRRRTFPVTTTRMPEVRCQVCSDVIAYDPRRDVSDVLTDHYLAVHQPATAHGEADRNSRP